MATKYHVQMNIYDENGNKVNMLPVADASDVIISKDGTELPESATSLQDVLNALGKLAFKDEIDAASTTSSGVVTLSNSTDDKTAETTAATTKAVSTVNDNAVHVVNDESVAGVKTFADGVSLNGAGTLTGTTDESGNKIVTLDF